MAYDATLSPAASPEARAPRALWPALAAWWSRPEPATEAELGYESAHPWALGVDTPASGSDAAY